MFSSFYIATRVTVFIPYANVENPKKKSSGLKVDHLWLIYPIPDPARCWGGNCTNCTSGCHGHFMSPAQCLKHIQKNGQKDCMFEPPSEAIKRAFDLSKRQKTSLSVAQIKDLAKQTLLPECDVLFWLQHLKGIEERRVEKSKCNMATIKKYGWYCKCTILAILHI